MSVMAFQMWEPSRQNLMAEHSFYIEQARKRLLTQFDDIELESEQAAQAHLDSMSRHFDPDRHDPSDFYEAAHDEGIVFYQLLSGMLETTRLSVIAGMYHEWDKRLREWMVNEIRHWHHGVNVSRAIWKADFSSLMDLLQAFDIRVKAFPCYERLNAMRLVVNVFKHGKGQSFDELRESFPEFLPGPLGELGNFQFSRQYLDHSDLKVLDSHLEEFSNAILDFWTKIPKETFIGGVSELPKWFEKEFLKDRAAMKWVDA